MTQFDPVTDRRHLTSKTYATGTAGLDIRIRTHQLYTRPQVDFAQWVLGQIRWRGDELVLDVGCGSGLYVDPVLARLDQGGRLVSADLSLGMLKQVASRSPVPPIGLLNADAMELPLATGSCDVVLANHVLYHLQDIGRGVGEIYRVLRAQGHLIAATNASDSMQRFLDEMEKAAAALGYELHLPVSPVGLRFNLENGASWIETAFSDPEMRMLDSELVFPEAEPAVAFVNSMRNGFELRLPRGLTWEALMDQVTRHIEVAIMEAGAYHVSKRTGVLIARKDGASGQRIEH
jgi:ubiquinone/menaquinone biosynthesis C-methylase UbiE